MTLFEQSGGTYSRVGDYNLPNLTLPEQEVFSIGKYGRLHLDFIKRHKKLLYISLLTSGKLNSYLQEIDETSFDRMDFLSKQMAKIEGVTEQLKGENQILWVQKMNNIRNRVEEIINAELIYA